MEDMFKLRKEGLSEEMEIVEMSAKLGGIIFRRAELNGFEPVYTHVFEKMVEVETLGSDSMLEILGDVGG